MKTQLEQKLAQATFELYWKGYFNKTWQDDGRLIKNGLADHFKEIIDMEDEK
ncbi:hypothetical protein AB6831_04170 [Carnobacterium divergens]|uniref:hypothetical protein n=1 Tax=Carnobacterium divergens TaxID=2748 RepID=UPI0039C9DAD9